MDFAPGALDDLAARLLETGIAPAVAVAVTDRERTLVARTYGAASPDALWPIASIGKSFTAVVALQLVEEGVLDLHAPVTDYVPWLTIGDRSAPITLHHLLTHTAGVIASSDRAPASTYDVIALAETGAGLRAGEHRHYSDVGYRAVGVVLEAVTGRRTGAVQQRVLDRLGMRASVPVMVHETRRRLPGGHVPFYDDRPWRREHGLAPAPGSSRRRPTDASAAARGPRGVSAGALERGELLSPSSLSLMKTAFPPQRTRVSRTATAGHPPRRVRPRWRHARLRRIHARRHGRRARGRRVRQRLAGARALAEGALAIASGRRPAGLARGRTPLADDGTCPAEWTPYLGRYRAHNPWLPTFLIAAAREARPGHRLDYGSERSRRCHRERRLPRRRPRVVARAAALRHRDRRARPARHLSGTPYYRAFTD